MNSYWVAHASIKTGWNSMGCTIATSFWDRCCFPTFVQHLEASFSLFSRTVPHHIAPKKQQRCWIKRRPILSHPLSGRPAHWARLTSDNVWIVLQEESIVARSWTSTNWNDVSTTSGLLCHSYWICCWRVASASTNLRSCWRRTFWAHAVIKTTWYDTCDFLRDTETITASHVCRYSNVHLIIALMAQSATSNFPR